MLKTDWDEEVPAELANQHARWREQLPLLSQKQMPRCYFRTDAPCLSKELHGFADASVKAYGAVVYVRSTYQHQPPLLALVTAKTKVAKLQPNTIPRQELCGAVLLTKLLTTVQAALGIPKEHVHAWSDSSIVLAWLDCLSLIVCLLFCRPPHHRHGGMSPLLRIQLTVPPEECCPRTSWPMTVVGCP